MNQYTKRGNDVYFHSKDGYYIKTPTEKDAENHFLLTENDESSLTPLRVVECSMQFLQIGEVDTMNERFQAMVLIKSKWNEPDPLTEYDPKKNWNPKLYIENASYEKFIEEVTYQVSQINERTVITETRLAKGTFWERMELNDFPLDVQDLTVCLSTKHGPSICRLVADPSRFTVVNNEKCSFISDQVVKSFRDQQKFNLYKLVKIGEKASYDMDHIISNAPNDKNIVIKPKFVAVCKCSRRSAFYLVNAYLFNLLITVLSMTLFAIDSKFSQNRISGTFTLILTSFSFKVVTSKSLPTIAYLTSLDKYQLINIVYLAMCCVWHSICSTLNIDYDQKYKLDKMALYCFASFFTLVQLIFVINYVTSYRKIVHLKRHIDFYISRMNPVTFDENEY